jgi:hypothetical protein
MKRLALALLLLCGPALAQTGQTPPPALTPAPAPAQPAASEPETVKSLGYVDSIWHGWRIVNGVIFPVEGTSFPESRYSFWTDPVCFNVYGLAPVAKYVVEKRMKEIAARIGAKVNRSDPCTPNVTIAFTSDPKATLQSIAEVRPWLVPGLGFIRNRVREAQPIQAWYANMIVGGSGRPVLMDGFGDGGYYVFNTGPMGRLDDGVAYRLGAVTVVVDTAAIMGMQLGTLADYFAMITLSEARFTRGCKEVESISNLMQKDCRPELVAKEITSNDLFMLDALYHSKQDRLQSLRMVGKIRRAVESEAAGERK